ncbi:hypothetical protein [Kineococcus sp. SYSU DK001]|uniref:hypothetical protein n=1 Tax=Kineococcus sp. SYSU DK001 TaxID=3383122 RepID=UPI003D7D0064
MSTLDETPDVPVRGAQTVAPVQASALQFAASILGEASYTPEQELHGTLTAAGRHEPEPVVEPVVQPVVQPVAEPVAEVRPETRPEPVVPAPRPAPQPVEEVVEEVSEEVTGPAPVKKGFFGRLVDKLLGRG